jgi:hypothetical protein
MESENYFSKKSLDDKNKHFLRNYSNNYYCYYNDYYYEFLNNNIKELNEEEFESNEMIFPSYNEEWNWNTEANYFDDFDFDFDFVKHIEIDMDNRIYEQNTSQLNINSNYSNVSLF